MIVNNNEERTKKLHLKIILVVLTFSFLFIILNSHSTIAKTENLGQIGYSNPLIELNYSEAVNLTSLTLDKVSIHNEVLSSQEIGLENVISLNEEHTKWGVQLSSLSEGNYVLRVSKQPYGGYSDLELDNIQFRIVFSLNIDFQNPRVLYSKDGFIKELWAQQKPFTLELETDKDSTCSYGSSDSWVNFQNTGSLEHSNNFSATIDTSFKCSYEGDHYSLIPSVKLSYLNEPLEIEANIDPEIMNDLKHMFANLSVTSNDNNNNNNNRPIFCYYVVQQGSTTPSQKIYFKTGETNSSIVDYYSTNPYTKIRINDQASKTYTYTVTCVDKSGREAVDTVTLETDFSNSILIDLLSPSMVTALVNGKVNFTLGVLTANSANYLTSTCRFDSGSGSSGSGSGSLIGAENEVLHQSLEPRDNGDHDETVWCSANNAETTKDFSYTVDSEAPAQPTIRAYDACGSLFQVRVEDCISDNEQDCDVAEYNFSLYKGSVLKFSDLSTNKYSSVTLSGVTEGESYTWKVTAYDAAGNPSPEASADTTVYFISDKRCDSSSPRVEAVVEESGCNMQKVVLKCNDSEEGVKYAGCKDYFNYSIIPKGYTCSSYNYTHSLDEPLVFDRSMRLCWLVADNNDNEVTGFKDVDVGTLSSKPELEILRPGDYTNEDPVVLQAAITMYDNGFCSYLSGDCESEGEQMHYNIQTQTHYLSLTDLKEGDYEREVECSFGDQVVSNNIFFTVDRTPPNKPILKPYNNAVVCNDEFKLSVEQPFCDGVTITNCEPVYQYNYSLLFGGNIVDNVLTSDDEVVFSVPSLEGQTYTWKVVAMDEAGNKAGQAAVSVKVGDDSSVNCDVEPPVLFVNVSKTSAGLKQAIITCDDDEENGGSGCTSQFNYSLLATNAVCNYTNRKVYGDPVLVRNSSKLCYYGEDNNDNFYKDSKVILVDAVNLTHCDNGVLDSSLGETDIDCGDSCGYCAIGKNCVNNYDCLSDTCVEGVCKAPSCDDGVLNGNESDVDCGGSCDACEVDKYCYNDSDCVEGLICDSKCKAPSDYDGDGIPDNIDDDDDNDGIPDNLDDNPYYNEALEGSKNSSQINSSTTPGSGSSSGSSTSDQGMNIFGLILIILGLLIMGGAGYWLYYEYKQKSGGSSGYSAIGSANSSFGSPGSFSSSGLGSNIIPGSSSSSTTKSNLSSEQVIALQKQREGAVRLNNKIKNNIENKQTKRDSLVSSFGVEDKDVDKKESSEFGKSGSANDLPKFGKQEIEEVSDDDFIDIRDVGKKEKKFTEQENKLVQDDDSDSKLKEGVSSKKKKKEIDETFGELDDLIGDK